MANGCCGFAVAVVADNGDVTAWGERVPPEWIDSAAAAELWDLYTVLRMSMGVPRAVTDWQGTLSSADRGTGPATKASMHLAKTWSMITAVLEVDISQLTRDRKFVWMPAHQVPSLI